MVGRVALITLRAAGLLIAIALAGCSDSLPSLPKISDLNPFKEKQQPLPGKRVAVLPAQEKIGAELADGSQSLALPEARANEAWPQPGGEPTNAPGHLLLSNAPKVAWTGDGGAGSSKTGRVTASPIVYDGRIYVLDANGQVTAFSATGGTAAWRQSLEPTPDKTASTGLFSTGSLFSLGGSDGGGYGGGLAAENGRIFGATGFGAVIALDPATGKRLWENNLRAPIRASPTAAGDRVYVLTTEGRAVCLSAVDGVELWSARGLPQSANLIMNASPAVGGDIVVFPYSSGDLVALKVADGATAWTESLTRTRSSSQLTALSDAARPVIDGGMVYAVGHAGRMVATQLANGERQWSINVPGTQMPLVAGESIYVVDTQGQVMGITRRDGKVVWTAKLPGASTWSGPVLAGGALWLVSNKGQLVSVEPLTGRLIGQQDLDETVYIAPIIAGGRMYVFTDTAKLIALN